MKRILIFIFALGTLLFWKTGTLYATCNPICTQGPQMCGSAQCNTCSFCITTPAPPGGGSGIFGTINPPPAISKYSANPGEGLGNLLNVFLKIMIVGAGIYALLNLLFAGYAFMSAGDDAKKVAGAWAKIWQSLLGLAVAAGAFVLAAIFGQLIFGQWDFILNPSIPTL